MEVFSKSPHAWGAQYVRAIAESCANIYSRSFRFVRFACFSQEGTGARNAFLEAFGSDNQLSGQQIRERLGKSWCNDDDFVGAMKFLILEGSLTLVSV